MQDEASKIHGSLDLHPSTVFGARIGEPSPGYSVREMEKRGFVEIISRTGGSLERWLVMATSVLGFAKVLHDQHDATEIIIYVPRQEGSVWFRGCRKHVQAKSWDGGGCCRLELLHDGPCSLGEDE